MRLPSWLRRRPPDNRPLSGPEDVLAPTVTGVDLDQDAIVLYRNDPTSLLMTLSLETGAPVMLTWDPDLKAHIVVVEGHGEYEGRTQAEALESAWRALRGQP